MLPIYLVTHAKGQPLLVELKSGETVNGILIEADSWMNVTLKDAIETSADGETFTKLSEILVKGKDIKYLRLPQELIPQVKAMNSRNQQQRNRSNNENNDRRGNYSGNRHNKSNYNRQQGGYNQGRGGRHNNNHNNNHNNSHNHQNRSQS
ncbi:Probable U6 snRNA-associated Sm-like protein LSm4 AltName: Full=Glycine-rich protein 10; Short=GRP 10 [Cyberlindnera jadinii]|uniref:LSM complex subunit LSM4 n=1 Tax=Cyberlindnera jadinii (strain ATCC 18201 / CBS 1600 / BCRC 20928 / JCM 3617 / NBRC 0987 / NRRL Y-1542) TaxID=983966 RepID=A0A0H5BZP8_CYBJN|nr:Probable U6 snRNA-associated Sm-like protein LSm4 AltName: Full=Glycine-rich protein 10; Short=GRP 10 [Cyberlindnera jadinii]